MNYFATTRVGLLKKKLCLDYKKSYDGTNGDDNWSKTQFAQQMFFLRKKFQTYANIKKAAAIVTVVYFYEFNDFSNRYIVRQIWQ